MTAFLDQYPLPQWLQGTPPHVWWGAAAALILVIVVVAGLIIAGQLLFIRRLRAALDNPGLAGALIRDRYTPSALLRRSRLIERLADKAGGAITDTNNRTLTEGTFMRASAIGLVAIVLTITVA